jgi:CheY-like chemotaxis protein
LPTDKGAGTRVKRLRVLVVEDEALVALLLETMLTELGHGVVGPVARLGKALEMAQREELDIAILDVNINGQETYAVAEALAARKVPFVFATGYDAKRLREPYRDGPVLQKPYMQSDLQKMIDEVCR